MATEVERIIIDISQRGAQKTARHVYEVGQAAQGAGKKVQALSNDTTVLGRALRGIGFAAIIRSLISMSDTYTQVANRLKLVTKETETLGQTQDRVRKIALETRASYALTAETYARVANSTKQLGHTSEQTGRFISLVNKTIALSGSTAREAEAGLIQFSQGLASGRLQGDELRSVLEGNLRLGQAIADGMGVPFGKLRQLGSEGKLTTEAVFRAIESQGAKLDAEFSRYSKTIGQSLTNLWTHIYATVERVDNLFGATSNLSAGISMLSRLIEYLPEVLAVAGAAWIAYSAAMYAAGVAANRVALASAAAAAQVATLQAGAMLNTGAVAVGAAAIAAPATPYLAVAAAVGLVAAGFLKLAQISPEVNAIWRTTLGWARQLVNVLVELAEKLLTGDLKGALRAFRSGINTLLTTESQYQRYLKLFTEADERARKFADTMRRLNEELVRTGERPDLESPISKSMKEELDFRLSLLGLSDREAEKARETRKIQQDLAGMRKKLAAEWAASGQKMEDMPVLDEEGILRKLGYVYKALEVADLRGVAQSLDPILEKTKALTEATKALDLAVREQRITEERRTSILAVMKAELEDLQKPLDAYLKTLRGQADRAGTPESQLGRAQAEAEERVRAIARQHFVTGSELDRAIAQARELVALEYQRTEAAKRRKQTEDELWREMAPALGKMQQGYDRSVSSGRAAFIRSNPIEGAQVRYTQELADLRTYAASSGRDVAQAELDLARAYEKSLDPLGAMTKELTEQVRINKLGEEDRAKELAWLQKSEELRRSGVDLAAPENASRLARLRQLSDELAVTKRLNKEMSDMAAEVRRSLVRAFESATQSLAEFFVTGERGSMSFSKVLQNLAIQLASISLQRALFNPFMSMLGMRTPAPVAGKHATGAILGGPTIFRTMGRNYLGGEAGKEGLLPLTRMPNGNLGVEASGGGAGGGGIQLNVAVNVDASGSGLSAEDGQELGNIVAGATTEQVHQLLYQAQRPGGMLNRTNRM